MTVLELVKTFICEWYFFLRNPTWWKRRTSMERALTLIAIVIFLIGLALAIALGIVVYKSKVSNETDAPYNAEALTRNTVLTADQNKQKENNICLTPGCVQAAANLLDYMDLSVDPCDDFYKFSCGNFIKTHNIPDDKSAVTTFSIINDALEEQLRSMIEEPIQPNEPKPFVLTKQLYRACMNKTAIKEIGLRDIKDVVAHFGGWPVVEGLKWREGDFNWRETVYKYRKVGYSVDYLIDFSVGIDLKNSSRRLINLDQGALGLKREFLMNGLEDKFVKAYYEYMVDIAVIFGADKKRAEEELLDSLKFEMSLANISLSMEDRRNATALYNPMTISEMQAKYQSVPWLEYINTLLAPDTTVTSDELIVISVPKYLTDLEHLLSVTPKRIQSNYLLWRAVASTVSYLTDDLRNRQLQYHTVTTGKTERVARWKECIDLAAGSMPNAAGALYVKKYFHEDARQNAIQMVADIRAEFKDILRKVDWMDEKTRKAALEKADSMESHIAYPDELLDNRKLEEFYDGLEMNSEQYLKSAINLTLFATRYAFKRLRLPVNKTDWVTHGRPAVVNAFYSSIENSIQFPAGILQGIFFNNDRPRYMNYGGIGFVIGHEITHGFDDQGRQFDKDGNLVDWWAPETQKAFIKKTQCIIDQYSNYTVPEINLHVNGINTQGENIADNGGLKEAYLAYEKWLKNNDVEPQLPGINLSGKQLFWVSSALVWCSKTRLEELRQVVYTDEHAPDQFRVWGSVSNRPEFAKDFQCPDDSKMNPIKKCQLW